MVTQFNLADNIYATANIVPRGQVYLWLGVRSRRLCICISRRCLDSALYAALAASLPSLRAVAVAVVLIIRCSRRRRRCTPWLPSHAVAVVVIALCDCAWRRRRRCRHCMLWLSPSPCVAPQANVMLEYTYEDAQEVLQSNLDGAHQKLVGAAAASARCFESNDVWRLCCSVAPRPLQATIQEDLTFIRESTITTEVNIARVFNHDVKIRREVGVCACVSGSCRGGWWAFVNLLSASVCLSLGSSSVPLVSCREGTRLCLFGFPPAVTDACVCMCVRACVPVYACVTSRGSFRFDARVDGRWRVQAKAAGGAE
jgi:hypothetical protein